MTRGQQSMEFVLIFVFSLLIFVILAGVGVSAFSNQSESQLTSRAETVARTLSLTISLIDSSPAQATYDFTFPESIDGHAYTVDIRSNTLIIEIEDPSVRVIRPMSLVNLEGSAIDDSAGEDRAILSVSPENPCTITIRKTTGTEVDVSAGC